MAQPLGVALFDDKDPALPTELVVRIVADIHPVRLARMLHLAQAYCIVLEARLPAKEDAARERTPAEQLAVKATTDTLHRLYVTIAWFSKEQDPNRQMRLVEVMLNDASATPPPLREAHRLQSGLAQWYAANPYEASYPHETVNGVDVPEHLRKCRVPAPAFGKNWTLDECLGAYALMCDPYAFDHPATFFDRRPTIRRKYSRMLQLLQNTDWGVFFRTLGPDGAVAIPDSFLWLVVASGLFVSRPGSGDQSDGTNRPASFMQRWLHVAIVCFSMRLRDTFDMLVALYQVFDAGQVPAVQAMTRQLMARDIVGIFSEIIGYQYRLPYLAYVWNAYETLQSDAAFSAATRVDKERFVIDPEQAPYLEHNPVHDRQLASLVTRLSALFPWTFPLMASDVGPRLEGLVDRGHTFIDVLFAVATRANLPRVARAAHALHKQTHRNTWDALVAAKEWTPTHQSQAVDDLFYRFMIPRKFARFLCFLLAQADETMLEFWRTHQFVDGNAHQGQGPDDYGGQTVTIGLRNDSSEDMARDIGAIVAARHLEKLDPQQEDGMRTIFHARNRAPTYEQYPTMRFFDGVGTLETVVKYTWVCPSTSARTMLQRMLTDDYVTRSLVAFVDETRDVHVHYYWDSLRSVARRLRAHEKFMCTHYIPFVLHVSKQDAAWHAQQLDMLRDYLGLKNPRGVPHVTPLHTSMHARRRLATMFVNYRMEDALRVACDTYPELDEANRVLDLNVVPADANDYGQLAPFYDDPSASHGGVLAFLTSWQRESSAGTPVHADPRPFAFLVPRLVFQLNIGALETMQRWRRDWVDANDGQYRVDTQVSLVLNEEQQDECLDSLASLTSFGRLPDKEHVARVVDTVLHWMQPKRARRLFSWFHHLYVDDDPSVNRTSMDARRSLLMAFVDYNMANALRVLCDPHAGLYEDGRVLDLNTLLGDFGDDYRGTSVGYKVPGAPDYTGVVSILMDWSRPSIAGPPVHADMRVFAFLLPRLAYLLDDESLERLHAWRRDWIDAERQYRVDTRPSLVFASKAKYMECRNAMDDRINDDGTGNVGDAAAARIKRVYDLVEKIWKASEARSR